MAVPAAGLETEPYSPCFYMAQTEDVGAGGEDLSLYGMIICNKDINITNVRTDSPNAIVLGYFSPCAVFRANDDGTSVGGLHQWELDQYNEYDYLFDADGDHIWAFGDTLWALRLDSPNVLRVKLELIRAMIARGFDAIFCDDAHAVLPGYLYDPWVAVMSVGVNAYWHAFLEKLVGRRQLGREVPVVGNVGFYFDHEYFDRLGFDGIYIEIDIWPARLTDFQNEVKYRYARTLSASASPGGATGDNTVCRVGKHRRV